jgi:hypothetical protein
MKHATHPTLSAVAVSTTALAIRHVAVQTPSPTAVPTVFAAASNKSAERAARGYCSASILMPNVTVTRQTIASCQLVRAHRPTAVKKANVA